MAIIEMVQFKLNDGVSEADLLAAAAEAQTGFLDGFAGFIRRELWRTPDGLWVDVVYWESAEAAETSLRQFVSHSSTQRFMGMIHPDSTTVAHYTHAQSFGA